MGDLKKRSVDILKEAIQCGYKVSSSGRAFGPSGRERKLQENTGGYLYFSFRYLGERVNVLVHQFQAFLKFGDKVEKHDCIRHMDGDKKNNNVLNLELGSNRDNQLDRCPKELERDAVNAATFQRKFTDVELDQIREFHAEHRSYKRTMEEFSIPSKGSLNYMLRTDYKTTK